MEKLVYQPYRSETYPINIIYVKDTNENRKILTEKMGKQYLDGFMNDYSYIKMKIHGHQVFHLSGCIEIHHL